MCVPNIQKKLSNAKINIYLQVLNKRQDNYHNINSIFYPIPLSDELIISHSDKLEITSEFCLNFPVESNLIFKASKMLQEYVNKPIRAKIHLIKNIPIGAGLGGGSSNAASTLLLLNEFLELNLDLLELHNISKKIGADVPFFLYNTPSLVSQIGDVIDPVDFSLRGVWLLLIFPNIHISTPDAYKKLCRDYTLDVNSVIIAPPPLPNNIPEKLNTIKNILVNDFEESTFESQPVLKNIKQRLFEISGGLALMSGSGSSIFALFDSESKVLEAKSEFSSNGYFMYHCQL